MIFQPFGPKWALHISGPLFFLNGNGEVSASGDVLEQDLLFGCKLPSQLAYSFPLNVAGASTVILREITAFHIALCESHDQSAQVTSCLQLILTC